VYDIAHRIGAYFGKLPENVYLHAGTRIGARAFNIKGDSIDPKTLPKPFLWLSPAEIEDCLCIYREELHGVRSQRGVVAALDAVLQAGNDLTPVCSPNFCFRSRCTKTPLSAPSHK
jgi:hypothetical protein